MLISRADYDHYYYFDNKTYYNNDNHDDCKQTSSILHVLPKATLPVCHLRLSRDSTVSAI